MVESTLGTTFHGCSIKLTSGIKIKESDGFFPKNSYREFARAVRSPNKVPRAAAVIATNNEFFKAA